MRTHIPSWLTLVTLSLSSPSLAQPACDPKTILSQNHNVISFDEDVETNLSLFNELAQSASAEQKASLKGSIAGYTLSGDDAQKTASSLTKLLNLNYTDQQKQSLFVSALPAGAVDAYIACLKQKDNITVTLSPGAVQSKEFLLTVNWSPQYAAPASSKVGGLVTNGSISEIAFGDQTFTKLSDVQIPDHASFTAKIVRNTIFEPTEISGTIDGKPFEVDVPSAAKFRLVTQVVNGTPIDFGPANDTCGGGPFTSCVVLNSSDEGVVIPGTFKWKAPDTIQLTSRAKSKETPDDDMLRSCMTFNISCEANRNYANIHRTGAALVVKSVANAE